MSSLSQEKTVPFSAAQVYDLVIDIPSYPEFLPWCTDSCVFAKKETEFKADLTVGFDFIQETFTSLVTFKTNESVTATAIGDGPFKELVNKWVFTSIDESSCTLHFTLDYTLKSGLLGMALSGFLDKAFDKMMTAFEQRAHEVYGHATQQKAD
jgi:coenzyme Q-binding protein COQ10